MANKKQPTKQVLRDVRTGRFTTKKQVEKHPEYTITETRPLKKRK